MRWPSGGVSILESWDRIESILEIKGLYKFEKLGIMIKSKSWFLHILTILTWLSKGLDILPHFDLKLSQTRLIFFQFLGGVVEFAIWSNCGGIYEIVLNYTRFTPLKKDYTRFTKNIVYYLKKHVQVAFFYLVSTRPWRIVSFIRDCIKDIYLEFRI